MKKTDFFILLTTIVFFLPFFVFPSVYQYYLKFNQNHCFIAAFLKFGILATYGEILGLRIKTGNYTVSHFGILPKACFWGLFGIWIAVMMSIYRDGVPFFFEKMGFDQMQGVMKNSFSGYKLLGAFGISFFMNTTFAPVFMTLHKITDIHIEQHRGSLKAFLHPIRIGSIIRCLNWDVQWNFVFKKTIPLFWIPAHTITFLLPEQFQVLFAALLSIALGLILSIDSLKFAAKMQKN